jgi:hypothetical protein
MRLTHRLINCNTKKYHYPADIGLVVRASVTRFDIAPSLGTVLDRTNVGLACRGLRYEPQARRNYAQTGGKTFFAVSTFLPRRRINRLNGPTTFRILCRGCVCRDTQRRRISDWNPGFQFRMQLSLGPESLYGSI